MSLRVAEAEKEVKAMERENVKDIVVVLGFLFF